MQTQTPSVDATVSRLFIYRAVAFALAASGFDLWRLLALLLIATLSVSAVFPAMILRDYNH